MAAAISVNQRIKGVDTKHLQTRAGGGSQFSGLHLHRGGLRLDGNGWPKLLGGCNCGSATGANPCKTLQVQIRGLDIFVAGSTALQQILQFILVLSCIGIAGIGSLALARASVARFADVLVQAFGAVWGPWLADGLAEANEEYVERAPVLTRDPALKIALCLVGTTALARLAPAQAVGDAVHVNIDGNAGDMIEGAVHHNGRHLDANARQTQQPRQIVWNISAKLVANQHGRLLDVLGLAAPKPDAVDELGNALLVRRKDALQRQAHLLAQSVGRSGRLLVLGLRREHDGDECLEAAGPLIDRLAVERLGAHQIDRGVLGPAHFDNIGQLQRPLGGRSQARGQAAVGGGKGSAFALAASWLDRQRAVCFTQWLEARREDKNALCSGNVGLHQVNLDGLRCFCVEFFGFDAHCSGLGGARRQRYSSSLGRILLVLDLNMPAPASPAAAVRGCSAS
eukprot:m.298598 g.298598  ORF g.298598 m.298598 type:complete len:454 (-) comp13907_c0_seq1:110-1471(-)